MKSPTQTFAPPIEIGMAHSDRLPAVHKSAVISVSLCAVVTYLCFALLCSQIYTKLSGRAADALPTNVDVLVVGSSVIAVPLMKYEFPRTNATVLVDRSPILETKNFEKLMASFGAPNLAIYNASAVGQGVAETEKFVKDFLGLNKHPRVVALFVAPVYVVGEDQPETSKNSFLPEDIDQQLSGLQHDFEAFHSRVQSKVALWTSSIYVSLHLKEPHKTYWKRFQSRYTHVYKHKLNAKNLAALARILNMLKSHSIKTLVVSTPLSNSNRQLMSAFKYSEYDRAVRDIVCGSLGGDSLKDGEGFVDLGESPKFIEGSDFQDGAHCNPKGGKKILTEIAPRLVQLTQ
jgi:hypothetical protein